MEFAVCPVPSVGGMGQSLPHTCTALGTGKRVYVHCTAGLGRAPAACIAYLFWASQDATLREGGNWSLDKARLPTLHKLLSDLASVRWLCVVSWLDDIALQLRSLAR